jgi:fatty acid desaturase
MKGFATPGEAVAGDDDRQSRARSLAEARYAFRWHLPIYLIVNTGLVAIWYFSGGGFPWPLFPIVFWGLGVVGHYIGAYHVRLGEDWIERETQKILTEQPGRR